MKYRIVELVSGEFRIEAFRFCGFIFKTQEWCPLFEQIIIYHKCVFETQIKAELFLERYLQGNKIVKEIEA